MAQVSYGTITITDTNDINRIYMEYCRSTSNQLSGDTVPNITRAWGETTPAWVDGEYIWQRAVIEESGTLQKTYGKPVCISGEKGETGEQGPQGIQGGTGAAGRSLKSTTTHYTTAAELATIDETNMGSYTWSSNVPTYNTNTPAYWVRVTNVYENPSSTVYIFYKDNGISDAVKTSHDANSIAASANSTANAANQTANTANTTANNANTKADQAVTNVNNLQAKLKYYWVNEVSHTNGVSGWTKPNYPAGTYAASGISGTTFDSENSSTYGYNTWYANGINLRYNAINLGQLTGTSLIFYHPSTSSQGGKAMELTGSALKFYDSTGSVAQATFGGTQATISGTINVYDGKIGNGSNYWYIGNYTDYNQNDSAIIKSIGTASIQLNETNTWRIATNRIHTAWAPETGTDAFKLHFPIFNDKNNNSKHWDYGLHLPTNYSDKFLYIRNAASSQTLDNLLNDIDDSGYNYWNYLFWIDGSGNVHAPGFYIGDSTTPIGGGAGTTAQKIINSDNTYGKGSSTKPIYIDTSGYVQESNSTVGSGTKPIYLSSGTITASNSNVGNSTTPIYMSGGTLTALGYTIAKSVPSNAVFTDENVNTSQANTTQIYLTGTSTAGSSTGKLKFDSGVYLTTTAGTLHATTFEGNLSGTASRATADGDGNTIKTTYLKLSGGNVTGAVTFGSSVSADELTVGDLVVNGAASFTNNLQANTINGVEVGASPKFTDTVTTVTVTGNGNAITSASASNGAVTLTKGTTFLTSYTETDPIFVASAAHGITSSDISNWNSKTSNTGTVTSVAASGSGGISISGSPITTSGTITIGLNLSTAINGLGEGSSPATREDYIVAQYAGGGTTTTSYHRRKLSNIFAALNKSDITTALGYTPPTQDTDTHYTTHLYVNNGTTTNKNTTTALTNGNVYLHLYDDSTKRDSHKISGSGTVSVTSDTSGNIVITGSAHPTALNGVSFADGVITFTKTDGNSTTIQTDNFVITQATGATALVGTDTDHTPVSVNGPVKFTDGVPVTMRPATSTGLFLKDDGTWATPTTAGSATNATNDSDGNPINTTYIKKSIGTAAGDIIYWSASRTPTRLAKGSNGQVLKLANGVPTWGTDNNDNTTYSLSGSLSSHKFTTTLTPSSGSATTSAFTLAAGSNISLTDSGTTITIAATDTNTATAVDNILDGSNSGTAITYAPYTARADKLMFYTGTTAPNGTTRLNLNGYLYATKLYSNGSEVLTSHQDISGKIDTAGTGLSKSGTTLNHSNSVTAQTTQAVYPIKIDAQGHISGYGSAQTILSLGTGSSNAYRGDYGNTAYTHATDSGRLTTAKSSSFYKFSVTAHGHVGSVTAVAASDITGLLSFGTAYNASSNKIATISDVTSAVNGATDKYVTLDTDQTLVANGTKKYLGLQTYGSNGVAFGVTSSSSITQKVVTKYDSTLDALVFQFS